MVKRSGNCGGLSDGDVRAGRRSGGGGGGGGSGWRVGGAVWEGERDDRFAFDGTLLIADEMYDPDDGSARDF